MPAEFTQADAARFAALGIRACVHAAVVQAGRVAALLFVNDAAPRDWSAEEVAESVGEKIPQGAAG